MTDNLPVTGGKMYVDTVTSYGPGMDQSELEPDFDVDRNYGVFVVPEEAAEQIEEINDNLAKFDYTEEERRELETERSELVKDAVTDFGFGVGYNLAVSEDGEELEPGDVLTLDQIGEHEYTGVFGLTDLSYDSSAGENFNPYDSSGEEISAEELAEAEDEIEFDLEGDVDEFGQLK